MEHFEFDPKKDRINKERHGVDLSWAQELWDQPHVIIPARDVVGESRFLILAKADGKCYSAVFTKRGSAIRLISCHRADRRLEKSYESHIQDEEDAQEH
ncbi:MAG: BrnT family toxin [Elusimicrobia bacterium]|nr:BrnT family toxin [Elusimicrobiota bacterium]